MSEGAAVPEPERKGNSNRSIKYECSVCQREKPREDLLAKQVTYRTLKPVKVVRARTVAWVCSECRSKDPAWNAPPMSTSPGMADTKMADGNG